jgi:hypothetical protein
MVDGVNPPTRVTATAEEGAMIRKALLLILFLCNSPSAWSRGGPPQLLRASEADSTCENVTGKDKFGRIVRSKVPCKQFEKMTAFPNGRTGYVVVYRKALECGGENVPENMQWVPTEVAKEVLHDIHKCNQAAPN